MILEILRYSVAGLGMFFLYKLATKISFMRNSEDISNAISDIYYKFSLASGVFKEIKEKIQNIEKHQVAMDSAVLREFEEVYNKIDSILNTVSSEGDNDNI